MRAVAYKTPKISEACDLVELIKAAIDEVSPHSVIAISSKIVAITEESVAQRLEDREELIRSQADYWLDPTRSKYGHHFTVKHNLLVGSAGIDQSNSNNQYVLLPKNPQETANQLRKELRAHYKTPLGVLLVDSASVPLSRGAVGHVLAHSGFSALRSYIGEVDLFDEVFAHSVSNRAQALAATATLMMGEGTEQTPLAVVSDIPNFACVDKDPSESELQELHPSLEDDLFEPFWRAVGWLE